MDIKDRNERAKRVIEQAEMLGCERYLSPKDIVEGSPNLNLAFVAQIFQHKLELAAAFLLTYVSFRMLHANYVFYAGMVYPLTINICLYHKQCLVTSKFLGKKGLFNYGSTVLELLHMLTICLRISGMGKSSEIKDDLLAWFPY